jgi:hypothetical protein
MYKVIDATYTQRLFEGINKSLALLNKSALQQIAEATSASQRFGQQLAELNRINYSIHIPQIYAALPVIDTSSFTRAFDVSNKIFEMTRAASVWQESFTRQITELTRSFDAASRRLTADIVAASLSFQSIVSSDIIGDLIKLVHENADAAKAFKEAGWPIAPSMPKQLKGRVVALYKQGKARYASQTIIGYYRRDNHCNLVSTVEGWQDHPLFATRMHIIRDALKAHCGGRYTLSIPALLPQVEGILNDYVRTNNLSAKFGKIAEVYKAVIGDVDKHDLSTWAIANTLLYQLQSNTYVYTSFESELTKSVRSRKTTRHTVLHGVAVNYDKPANSLKVFLVLDALTALKDI